MLALVLRALLYFFLARFLWRLAHVVAASVKRGAEPPRVISGEMVKDPVCGTYVVRGAALSDGSGAAAAYFCSEHCRKRFRAGHRQA